MVEKNEQLESKFTVGIGVVLTLVLCFFGWVTVAAFSHENRLTKVETQLVILIPQINTSLTELNKVTVAIREDQIRRQQKER